MKALVWRGERQIALEDVEEREPRDGEVVVEVELAGICGSDLHPYRGHFGPRVPPLVLGHEAVVRESGERFALYPLAGCGRCDRCLAGEDNLCAHWRLVGLHGPGVFAERAVVPRRSLFELPDGIDVSRATLAEPLACCVGALRPEQVGPETRVLVLGCGPIGLLTVFAAARTGAEVVAADPVAERRAHAARLGAARVVAEAADAGAASQELVVDCAGFVATWRAAIDAARNGGSVVVIGLGDAEGTVPMAILVRRAVTLRGQFGYTRADFARALELLADGGLDVGWITEMRLEDGPDAFASLVDRPAEFSKVLLRI